jgi:transcription-repair coupling factor (superfamily II helicase)
MNFNNFLFTKQTLALLQTNTNSIAIKFLYGSAKSLYVASLLTINSASPVMKGVLLAPNVESLNNYIDDFDVISSSTSSPQIFVLRPPSKHTHVRLEQDTYLAEVIDTISRFSSTDNAILLATFDAFNIVIPDFTKVSEHLITLTKQQSLDMFHFTTQLSLNGFQREQYVSRSGEFAVRGGIIDIFAPNMPNPIRVELWGNEIDSIRLFDNLSQRSIKELDSVDFIGSLFIDDGGGSVNLFEYISSDVLFIVDTPDAIDFSLDYIQPIFSYRILKINPLGHSDIDVKCVPQPKMNSSIQQFASELRK